MTDKKAMRDKAASLFLLGDVITEEMSFPRYTMIKQRKGAGRYGSYEYEARTV